MADGSDSPGVSETKGAAAATRERPPLPRQAFTPDERQALQDAKLLEEWRKTQRDAVTARFGIWLQLVAALASTATVIIAVLSMLSTSRAQVRQAEEARFADALKTVVDRRSNPDPSGAVAILDQFAPDPVRRHQMQGVLVQQLISADMASVEQISDLLLRYPDRELLALLARQNRALSRLIKGEYVDVSVFEDGRADARFTTNRSDTARNLRRQLLENVSVLTAAMERIRVVRQLDLSSTTLSLPVNLFIDVSSPLARRHDTNGRPGTVLDLRGGGSFRGIVFDSVDFRGAALYGARFEADTFTRSVFDDASLAGVEFLRTSFDSTDSFRRFGVTVPLWLPTTNGVRSTELAAPTVWRFCDFHGLRVSPSFEPFDIAFTGAAMPPDDDNRFIKEYTTTAHDPTARPNPAIAVIVDSVAMPLASASERFRLDPKELAPGMVLRSVRWGDTPAVALVDSTFDSQSVARVADGFWKLAQQGLVRRSSARSK